MSVLLVVVSILTTESDSNVISILCVFCACGRADNKDSTFEGPLAQMAKRLKQKTASTASGSGRLPGDGLMEKKHPASGWEN